MSGPRPITYIVIHHSATADGRTLSWQAIRDYHVTVRGWRTWGYHLGIEQVEGAHQVLLGRPWTEAGAHAPGRNQDSLGLCLVGNFDEAPPPPAQWDLAVGTVRWLCALFAIPPAHVIGHREATPARTCPGQHFNLERFREALL